MRTPNFVVVAASALAMSSVGVYGQSVISAHSGVLHYSEGDVTIAGDVPHQKPGTFAEVKEKQELATQMGRAEVLLTPGAFLRLGENSAIRMDSNKLIDTQVAFLKGSAIVDFVEVTKDNPVKIAYQDYQVTFLKKGIYRFDSEPAELKVYSGEAVVTHGSTSVHLHDGRSLPFTPALVSDKFDNRTGDALYRWAKRRSEYIAVANLSAARQMGSGAGYASTGSSSWSFNPYYSMYTFIPGSGIICDPFAIYSCYYSPGSAWRYYNNILNNGYSTGGGYSTVTSNHSSAGYYPTSIGTSSTLSSYSGTSSYSAGPSVSSGTSSSGFSSGSAVSSAPADSRALVVEAVAGRIAAAAPQAVTESSTPASNSRGGTAVFHRWGRHQSDLPEQLAGGRLPLTCGRDCDPLDHAERAA